MQKNVCKPSITDMDELKQRLRTDWTKLSWIMSSLQQPFVSGVIPYQRASRLVVDILSTVSDIRHGTVCDCFVADVDDMNSYTLFVGLYSGILSVLAL